MVSFMIFWHLLVFTVGGGCNDEIYLEASGVQNMLSISTILLNLLTLVIPWVWGF
jgi:hypothetical protein